MTYMHRTCRVRRDKFYVIIFAVFRVPGALTLGVWPVELCLKSKQLGCRSRLVRRSRLVSLGVQRGVVVVVSAPSRIPRSSVISYIIRLLIFVLLLVYHLLLYFPV